MKIPICLKFAKALVILFALLLFSSCEREDSADEGSFPQVADPPPFDYSNGEALRSAMHQLAFEILNLDWLLGSETDSSAIDQQRVVEILQSIRQIGEGLQESDIRENHPYLMGDMYRFLSDVDQALFDASLRTPRYYAAGRVSGSCIACHRSSD